MEIHHVEDQEVRDEPSTNRSVFMVNIGTHRLPHSIRDYADYQQSLSIAFKNIFARPTIAEEIFDFNLSARGTRPKDLNLQRAIGFRPIRSRSRFVIERGSKTGKIDAHILIDVEHDKRIQFNTVRFQQLLDEELARRNEYFIQRDIRSSETGEILAWPPPKTYVSVRLIGAIMAVDAERYITKSFRGPKQDQMAHVYPSDEAAERRLRQMSLAGIMN